MIYRYRALTKQTLQSVAKRQLFFAEPKSFNDPFDCRFNLVREGTERDWRQYLAEIGCLPEQIDLHIASLLANSPGSSVLRMRDTGLTTANSRVCCFSTVNDNILMWGHYADKHQGIALGFAVQESHSQYGIMVDPGQVEYPTPTRHPPGFLPFFDVRYSIQMPAPANAVTDKTNYVWPFISTKYVDWSYEKEVRIHLFERWMRNNPLQYPASTLSSIVLGLNTKIADVRSLVDAVTISGQEPSWHKCSLHPTDYAVTIADIPDINQFMRENGA